MSRLRDRVSKLETKTKPDDLPWVRIVVKSGETEDAVFARDHPNTPRNTVNVVARIIVAPY